MNEYAPGLVFAGAISASTALAGYFFSLTGIGISSFMTINALPLFESILSLNFLYAVILIGISLGIALIIEKKNEHNKAILMVTTGYCLGAIISIFLFGLIEFIIPAIIAAIAIPFGIGFLTKKEEEYEFMPTIRSAAYSAEKIILITTIGFFLYLLILGYLSMSQLEEDFVPQMLKATTGEKLTINDQMNLQLTELVSQSKAQAIDEILQQEEMKEMVSRQYYEAIILEQKLEDYKTAYLSNEFKQSISEALKEQNINLGETMLTSFPIMGFFAKLAWIIYAISALFLCAIIGNVFVKNIAALIYTAILRVIE